MQSKKLLFIYNPRAGKAQIRNKLSDIIEIFEQAGFVTTVRPTGKSGDAVSIVEERSKRYELVVCSGGDGTLDEVVTGMIRSGFHTPIGYIPAGSTNDFGSSLKLPKNMAEAARIAVQGKDFSCDVGAFNQDVFVYVAAFGLFSEVTYDTPQDIKNVLGHMAYLLEGVKSLSAIHSCRMKVTYGELQEDDETVTKVIEDDFILGMVTNSVSVGGFKRITGNNVVLDDGVFEVTLIKLPSNPLELNQLIAALLNRDIDAKAMYYFKTMKVTFESEESVAWTRDGEYGGSHRQVIIKNMQRAIEIRVEEKE